MTVILKLIMVVGIQPFSCTRNPAVVHRNTTTNTTHQATQLVRYEIKSELPTRQEGPALSSTRVVPPADSTWEPTPLELGSLLREASTARQPRMRGKTHCQVGLVGREVLNYIARARGY